MKLPFLSLLMVVIGSIFLAYGIWWSPSERLKLRAAAHTECSTLGGTLIISADERYICVPDAVDVGE